MRVVFFALLLLLAQPVHAFAQQFGPQPDDKLRTALLKDRETAWRTFFSNDHAGFTRLVPDELLAIGWDGGGWSDRAQTLNNMNEFAKSGRTLSALEFPRTEFQRYGDVVIMYSTFRVTLKSPDGTTQQTSGRGSEVFVLRKGRWIHTAWHLDNIATTPTITRPAALQQAHL